MIKRTSVWAKEDTGPGRVGQPDLGAKDMVRVDGVQAGGVGMTPGSHLGSGEDVSPLQA